MAWDQRDGAGTSGDNDDGTPRDRADNAKDTGSSPPLRPAEPPQPSFGPPSSEPPQPPEPPQPGEPPPPPTAAPAPPAPPPEPADPLRAIAVALLNLSGLGIGYAFLRRWFAMVVCWIATGVLLITALPAEPEGVSGGILVAYLAFLLLVAAHGAVRGLRTRLSWPPQAPVAMLIGLALLAVPAGGAVLYDGARDEAIEQMLLDRLGDADELVRSAKKETFSTAESRYRDALKTYHDINDDHGRSRAADLIPDRLNTYYTTIGAPYDEKNYCDAIAPLTFLREVPSTMGRKPLGSLVTWPDSRLATSLYECGVADLGIDKAADTENGHLAKLLTTFPESKQAAKVEPAVSSAIDKAAKDLKDDEPCEANERLRTLSVQASALPGEKAGIDDALAKDAGKAGKRIEEGTYACGVDQYKDGDFQAAQSTMDDFLDTYKKNGNRARAKKISIAAEIAQSVPAAGKHLPSNSSGGGISITINNDSPDEIEILYTGPVTGSFTLKACGGCSTYTSEVDATLNACKSTKHYPSRTISLPPGTTYFLHKPLGDTTATGPGSDTAKLEYGYTYTECAYVVQGFGTGYSS